MDVFEIRASLKRLAAALAAERITDEELEFMERCLVIKAEAIASGDFDRLIEIDTKFHEAIYKGSRNKRLWTIVNNLREQIQRLRTTSLSVPGRMYQSLKEHRAIVEALQARDVSLARQLAQDHIENAENVMMESIKREGLPR